LLESYVGKVVPREAWAHSLRCISNSRWCSRLRGYALRLPRGNAGVRSRVLGSRGVATRTTTHSTRCKVYKRRHITCSLAHRYNRIRQRSKHLKGYLLRYHIAFSIALKHSHKLRVAASHLTPMHINAIKILHQIISLLLPGSILCLAAGHDYSIKPATEGCPTECTLG
ncbi:hypothetical protein BO94DRAFT_612380, partial [Aspergillus sclerotioniger CBS 115572]